MSASKPLPRRCSSVGRIDAGLTMSWPFSRKYSVPRTDSASASRSSSARGRTPTASGIGGVVSGDEDVDGGVLILCGHDLLGPARVVAVAPAHVGTFLDHLAQLEDPVHERLGARGAAGHVD